MTLQEAKKIITKIRDSPEYERSKVILEFEKLVSGGKFDISHALYEILDDLVETLAYYVSNPEWRKKDRSFYGEEKLVQNIQGALQAIEALEIKNQNLQNEKD